MDLNEYKKIKRELIYYVFYDIINDELYLESYCKIRNNFKVENAKGISYGWKTSFRTYIGEF